MNYDLEFVEFSDEEMEDLSDLDDGDILTTIKKEVCDGPEVVYVQQHEIIPDANEPDPDPEGTVMKLFRFWGLQTKAIERLFFCGIKSERLLRIMHHHHIDSIFTQDELIGDKILFTYKLQEWRLRQKCQPLGCCSMTSAPFTPSTPHTSSTSCSDFSEVRHPPATAFPTCLPKLPEKSQCQPSELGNFNLKGFLQKTATGQQILANYAKNGFLVSKEQSYLAHIIIDYHLVTKKRMTSSLLAQYAAEIIKLFPSETTETYYIPRNIHLKKNTAGKLYDRYRNWLYNSKLFKSMESEPKKNGPGGNASGELVKPIVPDNGRHVSSVAPEDDQNELTTEFDGSSDAPIESYMISFKEEVSSCNNSVSGDNERMQLVDSAEVQRNSNAADEIRDLKSQLRKLTKKMTQMQSLVQKVGSLQNKPQVIQDLPSDSAEGRLVKEAFPLKCYDKMQQIEEQLESNENFYNEMVKHFDIICGSSIGIAGIGTGKKYSYILCDHFFDRQFLTSFTWTGSTRLEQPKRSMRDFKQILISFLRIINSSDATFNMIDLEEFFKCVLKNSRKRAESSESINRRMSAPKMKKKKNNDLNELDGYAIDAHCMISQDEEII